MKFKLDPKYTTIALYVVLSVLAVALIISLCVNISGVAAFFTNMFNVFKPILYAVIVCLIIYPLYNFYHKKVFAFTEKKKPHPALRAAFSIILSYVTALIIIALIVLIIVLPVVNNFSDLQEKMPAYLTSAKNWIETTLSKNSYLLEQYDKLMAFLADGNNFTYDNIVGKYLPVITDIFGKIFTESSNIVISVIISVYMIASRNHLASIAGKLMKALFSETTTKKVKTGFRKIYRLFAEFITGRILSSLLITAVFYLILLLLGVRFYYLIAILIGAASLIPTVGVAVAAILGIFLVFVIAPSKGVWFIFIYLAVQIIIKIFAKPYLIKKEVRMSVGKTLISLVVVTAIFGWAGLFFAVPIELSIEYIIKGISSAVKTARAKKVSGQ